MLYVANHVVASGSVGVLKANAVSFSPPLSEPKLAAIARVGFGNVIKIGLLFDEAFWPKETHYFAVAGTASDMDAADRFSYFLNLVSAVGRPILFTFVFGGQAVPVESWTDDQVWAGVRANLIKLFGASVVPAEASAMWRSSWATSENFRGSYSFASVSTQVSHAMVQTWYPMQHVDTTVTRCPVGPRTACTTVPRTTSHPCNMVV